VHWYAPVLNERIWSEMRNPNGSWRVYETYIRVAGQWTNVYRAVDSAGNSMDFLPSPPYRNAIAAKTFLQLAISQGGYVQPRVINVDEHPAYPAAVADRHQTGELNLHSRRLRPPQIFDLSQAAF
jgi:transposase-like protein